MHPVEGLGVGYRICPRAVREFPPKVIFEMNSMEERALDQHLSLLN